MTVTFNGLYFVVNPVHERRVKKITPEGVMQIEKSLDELASILEGDFEWVLTGGLVIPLTIGEFYRVHRDIDLGVAQEHLLPMLEAARKKRYDLFSRIAMAKISPSHKLDVYRPTSSEEALEESHKHLRLVRLDEKGRIVKHMELLDYFDVYVHRYVNGEMTVTESELRLPISYNFGGVCQTLSGKPIRLRNLSYIERLKFHSEDKVDIFDLKVIEDYMPNKRCAKTPSETSLVR